MTPTLIFWIRLALIGLMAYTAFTMVRSARRRGRAMPRGRKELQDVGGDLLSLGAGAFVLYLLQTNFQAPVDSVMKGGQRPLDGLRFTDVRTGSTRSFDEMKGKVVLLNLWATWCPPCRREMPDLHRVDSLFADKGAVVVALSDEDLPTVQDFLSRHDYRFTSGTLTTLPPALAGIGTRPVSILVDRDGGIADMVVGARGFDFFKGWVEKRLAKDPG